MVTPESFSHVGLRSNDVDATAGFMVDFLDAELLDEGTIEDEDWQQDVQFAALDIADKNMFVVDPTPYEAAGYIDPLEPGIAHFGFIVDDIEAAVSDWAESGGEIIMDPFVLGDTAYAFVFGPDEIRLEFVQPLE